VSTSSTLAISVWIKIGDRVSLDYHVFEDGHGPRGQLARFCLRPTTRRQRAARREAASASTGEGPKISEARLQCPVSGFYPSLHLNLGECCRKLGDLDRAREHLQREQAAVGALGSDGYGLMIKGGLDRLAERLARVRPGDGSLR